MPVKHIEHSDSLQAHAIQSSPASNAQPLTEGFQNDDGGNLDFDAAIYNSFEFRNREIDDQ